MKNEKQEQYKRKSKLRSFYEALKKGRLRKEIRRSLASHKQKKNEQQQMKVEIKNNSKYKEQEVNYNQKSKAGTRFRKGLALLGVCTAVGATSYTISYNNTVEKMKQEENAYFKPTNKKIKSGEMKYDEKHNAWYILDKRTNQYILVDNKDIGKHYQYSNSQDQYFLNTPDQYDEYYEYKEWYKKQEENEQER